MIGPNTFWTLLATAQDYLASDFLVPDIWDGMTQLLVTIWLGTVWTCNVMDSDYLDQCVLAQDKLDQRMIWLKTFWTLPLFLTIIHTTYSKDHQ